jgi:hypothetical protein
MPTVPVNQSVDVHWRVPAGGNLAGIAPGAERIRKFDCLIAAARFAVEKSAEGSEWVQLYLAVGPTMRAEDAFAFLASGRTAPNDADAVAAALQPKRANDAFISHAI